MLQKRHREGRNPSRKLWVPEKKKASGAATGEVDRIKKYEQRHTLARGPALHGSFSCLVPGPTLRQHPQMCAVA